MSDKDEERETFTSEEASIRTFPVVVSSERSGIPEPRVRFIITGDGGTNQLFLTMGEIDALIKNLMTGQHYARAMLLEAQEEEADE